MTARARRETAITGAIALLAVAVRLPAIWTQPFWEDEVASARIIRSADFLAMLRRVTHTETSPPLWYTIEWGFNRAGLPIREGRVLSAVLGGILVLLVVALARRLVPFLFAASAGAFVALGGEFVGHGHELRAYELLAVLSVAFGLALLRAVEAPTRDRLATLFAVVAAGGLTHYFFVFTAAAGAAWLWLDPENSRRAQVKATTAIAVGGLPVLAWLPAAMRQFHQDRFWWIGPFAVRYLVAVPLRLFTYSLSRPVVGPLLSTATVAAIGFGAWRLAGRREGRLVAALAVAPIAIAAALWAGGMHIFDLRNLIGTGGYVATLLVAAVAALPRGLASAVAAALATAVALALVAGHGGAVPPYDAMARALVRDGWTGAQPIAIFGDPYLYKAPLEWYLPHQPLLDVARARTSSCRAVYVVEADGDVRREAVRGPLDDVSALRRAVYLIGANSRVRCVRTIKPLHPPTVT